MLRIDFSKEGIEAVLRQLSFPVDDNYLCRFRPSSGWLGKLYPSLSGCLAFPITASLRF